MSKKSGPILYSKLLNNMGQDFLDVQYNLDGDLKIKIIIFSFACFKNGMLMLLYFVSALQFSACIEPAGMILHSPNRTTELLQFYQ